MSRSGWPGSCYYIRVFVRPGICVAFAFVDTYIQHLGVLRYCEYKVYSTCPFTDGNRVARVSWLPFVVPNTKFGKWEGLKYSKGKPPSFAPFVLLLSPFELLLLPSGHLPYTPSGLQLDCRSSGRTRKINFLSNQKGYDKSETSFGKLSLKRIQIFHVYFCTTNF